MTNRADKHKCVKKRHPLSLLDQIVSRMNNMTSSDASNTINHITQTTKVEITSHTIIVY